MRKKDALCYAAWDGGCCDRIVGPKGYKGLCSAHARQKSNFESGRTKTIPFVPINQTLFGREPSGSNNINNKTQSVKRKYKSNKTPTCVFGTCDRVTHSHNLCFMHSQQKRAGQELQPIPAANIHLYRNRKLQSHRDHALPTL